MSVDSGGQDRFQELATGAGAAAGDGAAPGEGPRSGVRRRPGQGTDRDLDPEDWAAVAVDGDERLLRERPPHW